MSHTWRVACIMSHMQSHSLGDNESHESHSHGDNESRAVTYMAIMSHIHGDNESHAVTYMAMQ